MNKIAALLLIIVLAACSTEKSAEQLNSEITKTRGKIAQLNQDLNDLEAQLARMDIQDNDNGIPVVIDLLFPSTNNEDTQAYIEQIESLSDSGAFGSVFIQAFSLGQFQDALSESFEIFNS